MTVYVLLVWDRDYWRTEGVFKEEYNAALRVKKMNIPQYGYTIEQFIVQE